MITKVNKKIIVLFIFIFIFSIYGCNTKNHMHEYQLKKDETNHYYECKCGDIKDKDEHNYIWIIDKEATIEEEGYKHQECNVCKHTQNENTKIEKNVHIHDYQMKNNYESHYYECECGDIKDKEATIEEEGYRHQECEICKYIRNENTKIQKINKNKIVKPIEIYSFESEDEYKQFVLSDETNYLYIDDIKIKNEIIYPISIDYQLNYFENESKPCLVISFSINNEKISNFYDLDNEESKYSMSFLFVLKYCEKINDIQYQFNKYNNDECIYNNVINIYNGDNIIGEIYYYDEFNIYHNRIIDFIDENLKYKTSIKKLNSGYLYINEVKKENEELEVTKIFYETYYDAEENNPYILISFSLYIKTLDNNITTAPNLRFHFILKYCENIEELQYKFDTYDDDKTIYEKVVYIYSGDYLIGEVYYCETVTIENDWIKTLLDESLEIKTIQEIRNHYLFINEIKKDDEEIYLYNISYQLINDENEEKPFFNISFALYCETLGKDNDLETLSLYHSITFTFIFKYSDRIDNLEYKFNTYNGENKYKKAIHIYSGNILIGEVTYNENLDIDSNWIIEFLNGILQ